MKCMRGAVSPSALATACVAFVGNPNTGKSTLFNVMTGDRQGVGNYPGVTVEVKTIRICLGTREVAFVDLPGTYSLAANSPDERIVVEVLTGRCQGLPRPSAVVCVVDATNLRRNLFLASQVADLGLPLVIALNMSDEAHREGVRFDLDELRRRLGVAVVPTVAVRGGGKEELCAAIERSLDGTATLPSVSWPQAVVDVAQEMERGVFAATRRPLGHGEGLRLLFDGAAGTPSRNGGFPSEVIVVLDRAINRLRDSGIDPLRIEATHRYRYLDALIAGTEKRLSIPDRGRGYAIDRILTHRLFGLIIFLGIMTGMFASIYWLAQPAMDAIEWGFAQLGAWASGRLVLAPLLQSLVSGGILSGVSSVLGFLPQIVLLFFFISILEDTGYMARAAFLMDKVFSWTGLSGKSFVPLLSSFACAVPAIMGTRTISDPKARLSTILIAPLMSCSARLPVYVLMIGAFVEPRFGPLWAGLALVGMHLVGLVVAIPIAYLIHRFLFRMRPAPFLLEMPPYRRPRARTVAGKIWRNGREFVVRAGTVIFIFSLILWALTYFPRAERGEAFSLESSYLGQFGKRVQPVFAPAGFDWKITVGVLASFPARELIVSTLGILYSVEEGSTTLRERLSDARWPGGGPVYTLPVAFAVMIFFAFCMQCGSTVAVIGREVGWRWAGFAFGYMTLLAWVAAVGVFQVGSRIFG